LYRKDRKFALRFFCFYLDRNFPEGKKKQASSNYTWLMYALK